MVYNCFMKQKIIKSFSLFFRELSLFLMTYFLLVLFNILTFFLIGLVREMALFYLHLIYAITGIYILFIFLEKNIKFTESLLVKNLKQYKFIILLPFVYSLNNFDFYANFFYIFCPFIFFFIMKMFKDSELIKKSFFCKPRLFVYFSIFICIDSPIILINIATFLRDFNFIFDEDWLFIFQMFSLTSKYMLFVLYFWYKNKNCVLKNNGLY